MLETLVQRGYTTFIATQLLANIFFTFGSSETLELYENLQFVAIFPPDPGQLSQGSHSTSFLFVPGDSKEQRERPYIRWTSHYNILATPLEPKFTKTKHFCRPKFSGNLATVPRNCSASLKPTSAR